MNPNTFQQDARFYWDRFNARYWQGKLPRPFFYLSERYDCGQAWAWHCLRKDGKHMIAFNRTVFLNYGIRQFRELMAHEMIHAAQWEAKSIRTKKEIHGRFFQRHHQRIFGERYTIRANVYHAK